MGSTHCSFRIRCALLQQLTKELNIDFVRGSVALVPVWHFFLCKTYLNAVGNAECSKCTSVNEKHKIMNCNYFCFCYKRCSSI